MKNKTCRIEISYELTEFRNTMVKPYYRASTEVNGDTAVVSDDEQVFSDENESPNDEKATDQSPKLHDTGLSAVTPGAVTPSAVTPGAVAPNAAAPNALNRAKSEETSQPSPIKRGRGRPRKQPIIQSENQPDLSIFLLSEIDSSTPSPRTPYAESRRKKINDLLNKKVFDVIILINMFSEIRLFNFRFVDEIKNSEISAAFEKSRLMIQIINDRKKKMIMTQSFTIQDMNQRLILILTAIIDHGLYFRNIFQAYVQSAISLIKKFYIRFSIELGLKSDHVFKIIKSLYKVSEVDAH